MLRHLFLWVPIGLCAAVTGWADYIAARASSRSATGLSALKSLVREEKPELAKRFSQRNRGFDLAVEAQSF